MKKTFEFVILISLLVPVLSAQLAQADCREAYVEALNQTIMVEKTNEAALATPDAGSTAIVPGIIGMSTSASSPGDQLRRAHVAETLQLIDDALLGSGLSLSELAVQSGRTAEDVAAVIRELNTSNRLCGDRLLQGDETRMLVVGILGAQ